jgi:hypothetical protein
MAEKKINNGKGLPFSLLKMRAERKGAKLMIPRSGGEIRELPGW